MSAQPQPGDVLILGRRASVQFTEPIRFRVIRINEWTKGASAGWIWLDGYELNAAGDAVEQRTVFVQLAGIRRIANPEPAAGANGTRTTRRARRQQ